MEMTTSLTIQIFVLHYFFAVNVLLVRDLLTFAVNLLFAVNVLLFMFSKVHNSDSPENNTAFLDYITK